MREWSSPPGKILLNDVEENKEKKNDDVEEVTDDGAEE
jgi:hypothetical protein